MENNAGLSGRVPELQNSSRLCLTEPDDKAKALNRGRTGETLNPNVKPFLSAASHTVVTCDERRPSETFYRHESREVRSSGLPGAVSSSGLAPLKPKSHEANLLAANALAACKLADSPCVTTYSPLAGSPR